MPSLKNTFKRHPILRIATRKSQLALKQTLWVKAALQTQNPNLDIQIIEFSTEGDRQLGVSLSKIGGKGLFTKVLEDALLTHEADIAVHSMKDLPTELPNGLGIGAVCLREDPQDVLISRHIPSTLDALPQQAILGTSSLRRQAQILALRSDLQIKVLRGNVDTRIQKLQNGLYDAIILAAAGLKRLNLTFLPFHPLPLDTFTPCAGQGAIGIEYRLDDDKTFNQIAPLNDLPTQQCVLAERTLNRYLGGSCQFPIGAYAYIKTGCLTLNAAVGKIDGSLILKTEKAGPPENAVEIGIAAAEDLLSKGAEEIIRQIRQDVSR